MSKFDGYDQRTIWCHETLGRPVLNGCNNCNFVDKNKVDRKNTKIDGDKYTPDPQFWTKHVIEYYQCLLFFKYKFSAKCIKEHPETNMFQSITFSLIFLEPKYSLKVIEYLNYMSSGCSETKLLI